ncbi:PREDICTED: opioid growth factor receptor-like, partial [Chinchilla lanigera]|uniref:opioid growth factor receptor-like n=1 Tax=Chinchilla lanigera TaxID=34839 RepID=UPI000696AA65
MAAIPKTLRQQQQAAGYKVRLRSAQQALPAALAREQPNAGGSAAAGLAGDTCRAGAGPPGQLTCEAGLAGRLQPEPRARARLAGDQQTRAAPTATRTRPAGTTPATSPFFLPKFAHRARTRSPPRRPPCAARADRPGPAPQGPAGAADSFFAPRAPGPAPTPATP